MKRRKPVMMLVGVVLCILGASLAAGAQRTEGTITGTVTDPNGAVVGGAKVVVTNVETGRSDETQTDSFGFYRVPLLRPGKYEVRIEAAGFKAARLTDIIVTVNVVTRADAQLQIGEVKDIVIVTEKENLVQTEDARLAQTFGAREIRELPLNGRDVYQLVTLQPGVTATNAPVISNVASPNSPVTFDFGFISNGATPRANNFVIDGTTNNNEWLGGTPVVFPSVDAIDQFQIQTLNFSAEYGRNNGAVTNVITRAGTNDLHGTVFYFHRNSALNARNFFDSVDEKTPLLQHQFGGALGGPIVKNKTFFFGIYEGSRRRDGAAEVVTVETPAFRQMVATLRPLSFANQFLTDFPSPACQPGTARDTGSIGDDSFGPFFVGPPESLDLNNPDPQFVDICSAVASQVQPSRADQYMIRVDHNFTNADRLFVRWIANDAFAEVGREELLNANVRGFQAPLNGYFADLGVGYTHTFGAHLLNDFRFAYSRNNGNIGFTVPPGSSLDTLTAAGTPDFFAHLAFDDGVVPFGGAIFIPRGFVFNTFTIADTLTHVTGRHALKYGYELRNIREDSNYELETRPFYEFNSIFNFANDHPWLLDGLVNRDTTSPDFGGFGQTPREFRWWQWAFFFQDDWKIHPRVTLSLGLRYEVFQGPSEEQNRLSNIILGSGSNLFAQLPTASVGQVDELFRTDRNNFAPRLGVAWDPTGKGKSAVRAGFSVAYLEPYSNLYTNASRFDPPETAFLTTFPELFPFIGTNINYTFPFQPSPDWQSGVTPNGGAFVANISPSGTFPDLRTAYSLQWFLGYEQAFLERFGFSVNYVETRGVKLYIRDDLNRFTGDICNATFCDFNPNRLTPGWGGIFYIDNGSGSAYHGLNAQLRMNYSHGLMFSVNYTYGKVLDIVTEGGLGDYFNVGTPLYSGTQDVIDTRADRGPSEFDVRHRLTLISLWDLPSPKKGSGLEKVFGGWQINSIMALQSGRPFSVFCTLAWFSGCDFNMDGLQYDRPDRPSGLRTSGFSNQDLRNGIFDVNTFCPGGLVPFFAGTPCLPVGTNGNLGRNVFRGPAFYSVDLAIFKNVQINERVRAQFRTEMFNLFNRVNLFLPVGNLASPNFGRTTSAFASRQIQFGLKFLF